MGDGVLGHLGLHAVEHVVVGANLEKNIAIIHHQDMAGQTVTVQVVKLRDVTLIIAQVNQTDFLWQKRT